MTKRFVKLTSCTVLSVGLALAQNPQTQPSPDPGRDQQRTPGREATTPGRDIPTTDRSNTSSTDRTDQTGSRTTSSSSDTSGMKSQNFSGTLVDASCAAVTSRMGMGASGSESASSMPSRGASADRTGATSTSSIDQSTTQSSSADRSGRTSTADRSAGQTSSTDRSAGQTSTADRSADSGAAATAGREGHTGAGSTVTGSTSSSTSGAHSGHSGGKWANTDFASCAVSPTTTNFALVTNEGRVYKLDDNNHMLAALKTEKKWDKAMSATNENDKRMKVKVKGTASGNSIKVESAKF